MGAVVGADVTMLVGGMILGPLSAWILKKFDKAIEGKVKPGLEMLVDNFALGIIGFIICISGYVGVAPIMTVIQDVLTAGVQYLTDHNMLPLSELFEPSEMPDCAYDDCAVVFSQTPFARYFTATQVLPDDTLLCVLRESENSIFKGKEKAEKQYRQQLLMYYKIINFSKGKNK